MFKAIIYFILPIILFACGAEENTARKLNDTINKNDSSGLKVANDKKIDSSIIINKSYDDLASYIAGLTPLEFDSALLNKKAWKNYSDNISKNWLKTDSTKIQKIKKWSAEELKEINENTHTVFYPFSGADILNSYSFFPSAKKYILVGLEPVGTLPVINSSLHNDSLSNYFYKINKSLYEVMNFSFFITKNMRLDFKDKDLDGTIHLILIFLKRTQNSIVNIKPIALTHQGEVVSYSSFKESKKDTLTNRGVEIDFVDKDSVLKKVYYFSINLANQLFDKNTSFHSFINRQGDSVVTYIKSASYLMHKPYFTTIRELILNKSNYVLQDDSGIPVKYFDSSKWNTFLYGTYNGTLPMFSAHKQSDLVSIYDSLKAKPLDFGIGYKHRVGQSNLMLFKKKLN